MRPISFFSAALCEVLCASSIPLANAGTSTDCVENCLPPTLNPDDPRFSESSAPVTSAPPSPGFTSTSAPATSSTIYTNTHPDIPSQTNPTANSSGSFQAPARANAGNTGVIIGGVIGGLLGIALILGVVAFFFWRRRRRSVDGVGEFGTLEKSLVSSSPPVYTIPVTAYSPPPQQPQLSPAPPITAVESHHLMGGYSEPRHHGGGAMPAVSTAGYAVGNQREVDEDGVSLRSPSPVQDGGRAGERDSVPRLPIYNRDIDNTDRGPAL